MVLNRIVVGALKTNCYVLSIDNDVIVIDPGDDYDKIVPYIIDKNILAVLVTHHHNDHVGALKNFDASLVKCYDNLEEREYEFGPFIFSVIYTPGHTSDSISFYFKDDGIMFTGDFLFKGAIGRFDFDDSDKNDMIFSLKKIKNYSNTRIFPGHGEFSTLDYEKENNIYFNCML